MALHKDRRRVSKESLALAVRKDFKDAMVQESEAITSFLYSVHNQGELAGSSLSTYVANYSDRQGFSYALFSLAV